jgi:uncharacterized repeat protein (TIGR01451 family)
VTSSYTPEPTFTATPTYSSTPSGKSTELGIKITATGDSPDIGTVVKYRIEITNNDTTNASNIAIWTTIPTEMSYIGTASGTVITPVLDSSGLLMWTLPSDYVLKPGATYFVEYTVTLTTLNPSGMIESSASTDYNDELHTGTYKHTPVTSDMSFYPKDQLIVFPNPFSLSGKQLKFTNYVLNSTISIYTLTGESVISLKPMTEKYSWDGKNSAGRKISPGIYYYVVMNQNSKQFVKGKIFVIR